MAERCGCYDQADDIVFGPLHECTTYPALSIRKAWASPRPADPPPEPRPFEHVLSPDEVED